MRKTCFDDAVVAKQSQKKGVRKRKGADAEAVKEQTNERTGTKQYDLNHGKSGLYVELCVCVCVYTSLFAIDDESYTPQTV